MPLAQKITETSLQSLQAEERGPVERTLLLPCDVKGMLGGDRRRYLLECNRLAPRDLNWPDDPLATVRHELLCPDGLSVAPKAIEDRASRRESYAT